MTVRKTFAALAAVFVMTFFLIASGIPSRALARTQIVQQQAAAPTETSMPQYAQSDPAIRTAFEQAVGLNRSQVLGFVIYDVFIQHIEYSHDGLTALLWMAMRDGQTGEVLAGEPGLSIARNLKPGPPSDPASWTIVMPSDATFVDQLRALPPELITEDIRIAFLTPGETPQVAAPGSAADALPLTGYKLPWAAGLAKRVTGSIGHFLIYHSCSETDCRYAYDFADGTMFPLLAAKGGTVAAYRTTCANNDHSCTNYLTLRDESTVPTTYQLYYHMKNESIPARLRTIGAQVTQGEYIGDADNTGYSTGSHLHFHIYVTPTAANYYWGRSVNFTFDDVDTNGGYPRTCYEATNYPSYGTGCHPGPDGKRGTADDDWYVSGNTPAHPPIGSFDQPADRQIIASRTVHVQGTASDDIQVTRVQVMANYDGAWKGISDITPTGNGPYGADIDLCAANIPDGPFKMTVRIFDREGSQAPGIAEHQLIKNFACTGTNPQPPKDVHTLFPTDANRVPAVPFRISASATDSDGGQVARVDFFWHGPDWSKPWVKLSSDTNGSDGWSYDITPAQYGDISGSALYVQAVGKTGGVKGYALWNLQPDLVTPVSQLDPLPAQIGSTVFQLNWSAADLQDDIDYFEIQYQESTSSGMSGWKDWLDQYHYTDTHFPGDTRLAWFTGTAGVSYNFRLRAVDKAGHAEAWPDQPEASTALSATCTPDADEKYGQSQSTTTVILPRDDYSDVFNFCKSSQSGSNDVDWAVIDAKAGESLLLQVIPDGGGTAFTVNLYGSAYSQPLYWQSSDYEVPLSIKWDVPATGRYYLEILPYWSGMFGTDMKYQVWYGEGSWIYLPQILR